MRERLISRMKKLILLSAVLFGTAVASQAGVYVDIGFRLPVPPLPFPGRVVISHPAPVYVAPAYCAPPRVVYVPPPVVCVSAPRYYPQPVYYSKHSHGKHHGYPKHGKHHAGRDDRGGHRK